MNRDQQLEILYGEVRRFFREGIDEETAYDRLSVDQRFSNTIQRKDIQKLYLKLQKKDQLKADKKNAEKHLIFRNMKKKFSGSFLKFWQGRYAFRYANTPDIKNHTFEIFDMFHQKLKQVTFPSHDYFVEIHALSDPFLLLIEVSHDYATYYVSLVKLEPDFDSLQVLQTIERPTQVEIHVDSIDPKKFVIQNNVRDNEGNGNYIMQLGKLENGQIQLGNEVEYQNDGHSFSYFDGHLYSFVPKRDENEPVEEPVARRSDAGRIMVKRRHALAPVAQGPMAWELIFGLSIQTANMQIFDLEQNRSTTLNMNPFPANVKELSSFSPGHSSDYAWVRNCCFVAIKFKRSENYGIVFANADTQNWTVLDLAFKLKICHMQFINAELMVFTAEQKKLNKKKKANDKVYKFQMRKPDRLRCIAWKKHLKFIKESTDAEDPYEAALPYLPYNSDVQPFRRIN